MLHNVNVVVTSPLKLLLYPHLSLLLLKGGDSAAILAAGLPNIVGTFQTEEFSHNGNNTQTTGAFYHQTRSGNIANGTGGTDVKLCFDASRSNSIYGNAQTVQPPAINLIPQIRF